MHGRSLFFVGLLVLVQGSLACSFLSSDDDDRRYGSSDDDDDDGPSNSSGNGRSSSGGGTGTSSSSGGRSSSSSSGSSSGQTGSSSSSSSSGSVPFDVTIDNVVIEPSTGIVGTAAPHVATFQINGNIPATAGMYFSPIDPLPANTSGSQIASAIVVSANDDTSISFTFTPPASGTYTLAVILDGDGDPETTDDVAFGTDTISVP